VPGDGVGQAGGAQPAEVGDRGAGAGQHDEVGVGQFLGGGREAHQHAGLGGQRVEVGEVGQPRQPGDGDPQHFLAVRRAGGGDAGWDAEGVLDVHRRTGQPGQHAERRPAGERGELLQPGREQPDVAAELVHQEARDEPLVGRRHERHRAVEGREDPAAVDVADDDHGQPGRGGQAHVGDVVGAQVDLGGGAGALADDDVEPGPQVGEAGQHLLQQRGLHRPVRQRGHVGHRPAEDDDLAGVLAAGLEQHRVHRGLGLDARRRGLHDLRPADLRAVEGDHRVVAHVLRLERRDRHPLADQPAADAGGHHRLAGVGRRPGDEQGAAGGRAPGNGAAHAGGCPQPAFSWPESSAIASMIRSVTTRRARPLPAIPRCSGKVSGSPKVTDTLCGRGQRESTGCTRSVPCTATGTTGQSAVSASHATPVLPRASRPSRERVPSG
jgi:hypothetical protein